MPDSYQTCHNPYFNRWFSAIVQAKFMIQRVKVTILILIDGFLQSVFDGNLKDFNLSHNPYFNRWFSAIQELIKIQDFSGCHNPYFNRWFSAIKKNSIISVRVIIVTILILIDGFLQYSCMYNLATEIKSQSLF